MGLKIVNKICIINVLCLLILLIFYGLTFAGEVYVPEPIVFVHGLNSSESIAWTETKNELEKYFIIVCSKVKWV
jgi:hypothetical protein